MPSDTVLTGALGSAGMLLGEVVRVTNAQRTVTRAQANNSAGVKGVIGVAQGDTVIFGGAMLVRLEAGLVVAPGETLYVSATQAGRATNVAPVAPNIEKPIGTIFDTTLYSQRGLVLAMLASDVAEGSDVPPATNNAATGLTANNATATNQNKRLVRHETFMLPELINTPVGSVVENNLIGFVVFTPGCPRTLQVVFPVGWAGGDVVVAGILNDGSADMEIFPGGNNVTRVGAKAFMIVNTISNTLVGPSGVNTADVVLSNAIGVSVKPVASFLLLAEGNFVGMGAGIEMKSVAFNSTDPASGVFVPNNVPDAQTAYEVWYEYDHTHTQNAHTHGVTDPQHNHTIP